VAIKAALLKTTQAISQTIGKRRPRPGAKGGKLQAATSPMTVNVHPKPAALVASTATVVVAKVNDLA